MILGASKKTPLWAALKNYQRYPVSEAGAATLARVVPILHKALKQRERKPLRQWLTETWVSLGAPEYLTAMDNPADLERFFSFLEGLEAKGRRPLLEPRVLDKKALRLFATPAQTQNNPVQIMTIHKAKGLEFDVVILPGLERGVSRDTDKLLLWSETITSDGKSHLLLAPIRSREEKTDAIYRFLKKEAQKSTDLEQTRLLYVAMTRAKKKLVLLGQRTEEDE